MFKLYLVSHATCIVSLGNLQLVLIFFSFASYDTTRGIRTCNLTISSELADHTTETKTENVSKIDKDLRTSRKDPEGQKVKNHSFKKRFFFPYKKKNNLSALLNEFQVKQLTPSANKRFPRYLSLIPSKNIFIYLSSTQRERVRERKKERKKEKEPTVSFKRTRKNMQQTYVRQQTNSNIPKQVGSRYTYYLYLLYYTYSSSCIITSVTRLVNFLQFLVTKFITKVSQIIGNFLGYFEKTSVANFYATFGNI